jgi:hypothetical protein
VEGQNCDLFSAISVDSKLFSGFFKTKPYNPKERRRTNNLKYSEHYIPAAHFA